MARRVARIAEAAMRENGYLWTLDEMPDVFATGVAGYAKIMRAGWRREAVERDARKLIELVLDMQHQELAQALEQRDRARALACRLEEELALIRRSLSKAHRL
jgi:hypothetical protein